MSNIQPAAVISGIGAALGGTIGLVIGGPSMMAAGAKAGLAVGIQTAMISKVEQAADKAGQKIVQGVDVAGKKISEGLEAAGKKTLAGIDAAGRKVDVIADKTGNAIQEVGRVIGNAIENIASVWSKYALAGYALNIGLGISRDNIAIYKENCMSAYDNIHCAALSFTTVSTNVAISIIVLGISLSVFNMLKKEKKNGNI